MDVSNRQVISVSELNRNAKRLLEQGFPMLFVEGEISNFAAPGSGHWYFTLKDDKAQLRCAMFKSRNLRVRFRPKNGQQVVVRGRVSLYEGRGEFQMIADSLEDSGDGALRRAFEELKTKLQGEGLFEESRKRPVPAMPGHIAVVTSPTGAAIRDVVTVMRRRFPAIHLSIVPVQVQGDESVARIVRALAFANEYESDPFDLILLTRGGGSLEDLWSFNTEPVARAVADSRLPVVCAVGHESDVSIADFVADLRAPTPSAAAELITPDGDALAYELNRHALQLASLMRQKTTVAAREVLHLKRRLRHPRERLEDLHQRTDDIDRRMLRAMRARLGEWTARLSATHLVSPRATARAGEQQLAYLHSRLLRSSADTIAARAARLGQAGAKLDMLSPLATLERGYAIVTNEAGNVITSSEAVSTGERIRARLQEGELIAEVAEKT